MVIRVHCCSRCWWTIGPCSGLGGPLKNVAFGFGKVSQGWRWLYKPSLGTSRIKYGKTMVVSMRIGTSPANSVRNINDPSCFLHSPSCLPISITDATRKICLNQSWVLKAHYTAAPLNQIVTKYLLILKSAFVLRCNLKGNLFWYWR